MRTSAAVAAFVTCFVWACSPASAQGDNVQAFRFGRTLLAECKGANVEFCIGYVAGITDVFAGLYVGSGSKKYHICAPADATPVVLSKVVVDYIEKNGTQDQDAASSVFAALMQKYPCP